jgi:predicted DNA binding CopG/RHH family protein
MKKKNRTLKTTKAERLRETDLSHQPLSDTRPPVFEFQKKDARVNMRLPVPLLNAVKRVARARGIPYQRFIGAALEGAVTGPGSAGAGYAPRS